MFAITEGNRVANSVVRDKEGNVTKGKLDSPAAESSRIPIHFLQFSNSLLIICLEILDVLIML